MSVRLAFATVAAVVLIAPAALAQPANPDPAAVKSGTYEIEPTHTQVMFSVSHMGFTTWYGDFTHVSGQLKLDPTDPKGSRLNVTLPIDSITTTSAKLDSELKSADWFDAAKFPDATFRSTSVNVTGPSDADVAGQLTLHGVTRPEVLHVHFNGAGSNPLSHNYTSGFEVSGTIRRSDFGVSKYVPLVGDEVRLIISAAFERQPG